MTLSTSGMSQLRGLALCAITPWGGTIGAIAIPLGIALLYNPQQALGQISPESGSNTTPLGIVAAAVRCDAPLFDTDYPKRLSGGLQYFFLRLSGR